MSDQTTNPMNDWNTAKVDYNGISNSGAKISRTASNTVDKNGFLKILVSELQNQDPENSKDTTEYISQMAQFTSLEQMLNLNNSLNFSNASGLVGKYVGFNSCDDKGNPYSGVVTNVTKKGDTVTLNVKIGKDEYKTFSMDDVNYVGQSVLKNSDITSYSSLIGKNVEVSSDDDSGKTYTGVVKSVFDNNGNINLSLDVQGTGILKNMDVTIGDSENNNVNLKGAYTGTSDTTLKVKYDKSNNEYDYTMGDGGTWTKITGSSAEVSGITITPPTSNPSKDVTWSDTIKAANPSDLGMHDFSSDYIVEIQ